MKALSNLGRITRLPFFRRTVQLQIGTTGGMLIQAIANIALARLLGPEQFGNYALAFSVASVASIFLGAGAVDAVTPSTTRAWHKGDAQGVHSSLSFLVKFVVIAGGVSLVVAFMLPLLTSQIYHSFDIGTFAALILVASVISTLVLAIVNLGLQVENRIKTLSVVTLTDVLIRFGISVLLVVIGWNVLGAVVGQLMGALLMSLFALWLWQTVHRLSSLWPSPWQAIRTSFRTSLGSYIRPTLWVMADRNIAMMFSALPIALIGLYVSSAEVSYFKIALGYITLALSLLGPISVLLNVEFPKLQATSPERLRSMFVRVSLGAMVAGAMLTSGALIVAPWVFRFLYGARFIPAIPYAYGFIVFGALFGIGVGLGPMWRAVGRVHTSILINLITLGIGVPLGIILIHRFDLWGAVAMVTAWYVCSQGISFFYLLRLLRSDHIALGPQTL